MRDRFFSELHRLFISDRRIVFITGDLGYKLFNPLMDHDPGRVINFGVREAAMIGFAAGLARGGMVPYVYSIVPFLTLRCLEQIKIDLCYNKSTVVLVGVGGGYCYGPNGPTHHGMEDIGVLSALPGMRIFTPADPQEVSACLKASLHLDGPAYLRLGRNGEPNIHQHDDLDVNIPQVIRAGSDGIIITNGFILNEVLKAEEKLKTFNVYPSIIQLVTMKPFPDEFLADIIADGKPVMTVEEHIISGGLGLRVAVVLAESRNGNAFKALTMPDDFCDCCMDRQASLKWAGLDVDSIVENFLKLQG